MKIAVIGSRNLAPTDIGRYISSCEEIVTGGAVGVDTCAEEYAKKNKIRFTVFYPDYKRYGRAAPILRNRQIVDYADEIVAFWDGESKGTLSVIQYAAKMGKACKVIPSKRGLREK